MKYKIKGKVSDFMGNPLYNANVIILDKSFETVVLFNVDTILLKEFPKSPISSLELISVLIERFPLATWSVDLDKIWIFLEILITKRLPHKELIIIRKNDKAVILILLWMAAVLLILIYFKEVVKMN